jgi:hypothetical protein
VIDVRHWGTTEAERSATWPADRYLPSPDDVLYRAVDVDAPAAVTFRWLCQLRVAPYSYDWLDNFGRQSPQTLTPGLEDLALGQTVMRLFEIVDFAPGRQVTARTRPSPFGVFVATYAVVPIGDRRSRIVVKLLARYPPLFRTLGRWTLPFGDWVMMRRQLLNLKALAEETARRALSRGAARGS